MQDIIKKADILIEALPYIRAFRRKIVVIKYGGSILADDKIRKSVLQDIVFLNFIGLRPVLVHGGGPHISERLKQIGRKTEFFEGMRVTDKDTLKIVSEELSKLNKKIVDEIKAQEASVVGISGDKDISVVRKKKFKKDLGFVGEIVSVDHKSISKRLGRSSIVVIRPMGIDRDKQIHNINADEVASFIAAQLKAEKLVLLTNVKGIMRNPHDEHSLISHLTIKEVNTLTKEGVIQEGMIPKVDACIRALEGGVKKTHIIDARIPHALLLEIFTDKGIGTEIIR
jgi:acetylglutamate kinase